MSDTSFTCPSCATTFNVSQALPPGSPVQCAKCGTLVPADAPTAPPRSERVQSDRMAAGSAHRRETARSGSYVLLWVLLAVGGIVVVGCGGVVILGILFWLWTAPSSSPQP